MSKDKKTARERRVRLSVVGRDGTMRTTTSTRSRAQIGFPVKVQFERMSSTPSLDGLVLVHQCGRWLGSHAGVRVVVTGHANKRGSNKAARALARGRAKLVQQLLMLLGARMAQVILEPSAKTHESWPLTVRNFRGQHRIVTIDRLESAKPARKAGVASTSRVRARAASGKWQRMPPRRL